MFTIRVPPCAFISKVGDACAEETGEVLENWKPKEKSVVVFEWTLTIDGEAVMHEQRLRVDNANSRGVPLPGEFATPYCTHV